MIAVSDFSGFWSSIWALARAAAIAPMVALERCMVGLQRLQIETDSAGFGAFGSHPMPDRLLGVLRHQFLEFKLCGVMFKMSRTGSAKYAGEFHPRIRCA